ncbi:sensor histidine kinase [Alterinioella nitratireducens]|uniref:sensor histidine kinase n=1 Tax=Alterinioella nitratireducens TaxID=2735915 RepID=UPI00155663D6|nr:sensor histidine kinase [Alterinioella nitratireducens]NPD20010.1 sensor histidine kinase [Alterinioella nitratireducens]
MTLASDIGMQPTRRSDQGSEIVLGEDWDRPAGAVESELRDARAKRGFVALRGSPLARKILVFNTIALVVLVGGVLFVNSFRDSLVLQRERALAVEAQLVADIFEASLPRTAPANLVTRDGIDPEEVLGRIGLDRGLDVYVYAPDASLVASTDSIETAQAPPIEGITDPNFTTQPITDFLNWFWDVIAGALSSSDTTREPVSAQDMAEAMIGEALEGVTVLRGSASHPGAVFIAATPIEGPNGIVGVVTVATAAGEIDQLVRAEREQVLQIFFVALLVAIGLSLLLAANIANPLADLAAAAELGRDKNARKMSPTRVRIPDLTGRPDEIGRLSGALRGMVAALYDRIDGNEQFAADVAHEIKNPLASLRSAVGTMHVARTDDQRKRLLEVIEHDVRRLDRLVSDISNASRLDSELVKEEEEEFDLVRMLTNLAEYNAEDARGRGIEFISDLPAEPIRVQGLEGRLAQVFVNLITNAISFCDTGDAVRIWARQRDNRVLVVVEDTGPGIPETALTKVFNRFYSERPVQQFGDHSGLGLAISKQIVEAHGGVIWAENIRPTEADMTSDPLGARFVVGLPL